MRYITKLIKSINIDNEEIPEEEIVQVFLSIKPEHSLLKIKQIINKRKLTEKQKQSLYEYIKHTYITNYFIDRDFIEYYNSLIQSLPLTTQQKVAIENELNKYNKQRFKFD